MNTRNSITSQDEKLVNMQMSMGYKSGLQKQLNKWYLRPSQTTAARIKGYWRLEPYEGKLSCTVLRRGGGSNLSFLFGDHTDAHGYDRSVFRVQSKRRNPEFKRVIFTNDRKERFKSETPNPCVSVESVSSVFPSV